MTTVAFRRALAVALAASAAMLTAAPAQAQPFGTFTWQLQPFCNRVTVSITQDGAAYTLDGFDDQCGAPQRAPLVGTAVVNPDGSVALGLAIVTTGGRSVHVDAQVSPATGSGTWRDSEGSNGTFALGASTGGSARREPTGAPVASSFIDVSGASLTYPYGFGVLITGPTPPLGAAIVAQWGEAPTFSVGASGALKGISRDSMGVIGFSTNSLGVYGYSETQPGVGGQSVTAPGVAGASHSGPGVWAESLASSGGTALELSNGALKVSGPVRPAFRHVATAGNTSGNVTTLDHPLLNGVASALVYVTPVWGAAGVYVNSPIGVYYSLGRWRIFRQDLATLPVNAEFNVLVVSQ